MKIVYYKGRLSLSLSFSHEQGTYDVFMYNKQTDGQTDRMTDSQDGESSVMYKGTMPTKGGIFPPR